MYRKVDKDQNKQGYIRDQAPAQRDGAILAFITKAGLDSAAPKDGSSAKSPFKRELRSRSIDQTPKLEKALVLMGGDRLQRAFNDTFIMPL